MTEGPLSRRELINLMADGAERVCDHAEAQWLGDKYQLGREARQENLRRWSAIRQQVREFVSDLKEATR